MDETYKKNVFLQNFFKNFFCRRSIGRQRQTGGNFRQWSQHKCPLPQARVGDFQPRQLDLHCAINQQVQVYNSRTPPKGSHPAHFIFKVQQSV